MGVSTSLYSGLSGLMAHQRRMDVIGNNIANVNTPGFRSSRVLFRNAFAQTLSIGTAPTGSLGGVNPVQIGLGTTIGATSTNFTQGSIEPTGVPSDLAISGNGFFVVRDGSGRPYYTRDGSFSLGADQILTNSKGMVVQGWMANSDFDINPSGSTGSINIQLGSMRLAKATQNVYLTGNLNAAGSVATQGTAIATQSLVDSSTGLAAAAGTLLAGNLTDAGGIAFFAAGDVITLSASKGGRELPASTFTVTAGSTLGGVDPSTSLAAWLEATLGINTSAGIPGTPGITLDPATGSLVISGNLGAANDIGSLMLSSSGATTRPITFTTTASADGESGYTPFAVYDTLGNEIIVNVAFVLEEKASAGSTWRWYAESADDSDLSRVVGSGTVTFDTSGAYQSDSGDQIVIDRAGTGADTLSISPNLRQITQLATRESEVALTLQDGAPEGTLNEYAIGGNGVISGIFTNGLVATLAQVALATFSNNQGLYAIGDNLYSPGPNAGTPQIGTPGSFGSGTLVSGALEQSNVDLANEFVNLIVTQTGYTANSRIISASNDMLAELLNTVR